MTATEDLDIEVFLRAARAPAATAETGKDAVRARLLTALGPSAFEAPRIPPSPSPLRARAFTPPRFGLKPALLLAGGFALGVAAHATFVGRVGHEVPTHGLPISPAPAAASNVDPNATPSSRLISLPAPSREAAVDIESLPTASSFAPERPTPLPMRGRGDLAAERILLETARTALERSDPSHALEALQRHQERFPRGQLREERESLRIGALVAAGRVEEARVKTDEFHRSFPGSLQAAALDLLVRGNP
jgi:hypothetical protein